MNGHTTGPADLAVPAELATDRRVTTSGKETYLRLAWHAARQVRRGEPPVVEVSVFALAAEMGRSPTTTGRALHNLTETGWVDREPTRFETVRTPRRYHLRNTPNRDRSAA